MECEVFNERQICFTSHKATKKRFNICLLYDCLVLSKKWKALQGCD